MRDQDDHDTGMVVGASLTAPGILIGLALAVLLGGGCSPIDDAVDRAATRCEATVEEQLDGQLEAAAKAAAAAAWATCAATYEAVIDDMQAAFESGCGQYANGLHSERMKGYGCVYDPAAPAAWTCSATPLCEARPQ